MRSFASLALLATFALGAACGLSACQEDARPAASGESHWLDPCGIDGDCAAGACLCGACTAECADDADCMGGVCEESACGRICRAVESVDAGSPGDARVPIDAATPADAAPPIDRGAVDAGEPDPPVEGALVINEIRYGPGPRDEYVEVLNLTDREVSLNGIRLEAIGPMPPPDGPIELDEHAPLAPNRRVLVMPADSSLDDDTDGLLDRIVLTWSIAQVDGVALMRGDAVLDSVVYRGASRPENRVGPRVGFTVGRCEDGRQTNANAADFVSQPPTPAAPNACPAPCMQDTCPDDQLCDLETGRCRQACAAHADCGAGRRCQQDCDDSCDQREYPNACCQRYCVADEGTQWRCEAPYGSCAAEGAACPDGTTREAAPGAGSPWLCAPQQVCCVADCAALVWIDACESHPACAWVADDCYPGFCSSPNTGACVPR